MIYLYVLASAIVIIGITLIFQATMSPFINGEMEKNRLQKLQSTFFIRVAILEAIPILLVVFTFIMNNEGHSYNITVPIVMIVILFAFGMLRLFVPYRDAKASVDDENLKRSVTTFFFIAAQLMASIPIISIVFLLMAAA